MNLGGCNMGNEKKISPYLKPKIAKIFNKGLNVWIIKPTGHNQGRGIEVFNSLEKLNEILNEYLDGSSAKKGNGNNAGSDAESGDDEEQTPNTDPTPQNKEATSTASTTNTSNSPKKKGAF
eukprot:CAMPEP_0114586996 /NCGR_PEP_ID=MMETSP0125-20121206/10074_1 /TAXON_ID=485358 ORGANISM="Aristerostoma sp., Strain ATCC 50986" /NCGR_SAMPLE_ID=MMETSP0125 /ASSEMBLY_ACC=CAM_ASM_000245 /LENGTH=120 /DNA_ID=CAMNT_0001782701 /DNA_START=763 /DNA_END=1125 /DNA_ORIENTATION=-